MNKIKLLFLLPAAVLAAAATAQNVTTPYSMYGYGILGDRATSMQRQMGIPAAIVDFLIGMIVLLILGRELFWRRAARKEGK